jgi:hypothetical protein
MDSLPSTFFIEIDGRPISKFNGTVDDWSGELCKLVEGGSEPAVFELRGGRLMSDGHILTRHHIEDLSLMPKRVLWIRPDDRANQHKVVAEKNGDDYSLTISGRVLCSSSLCLLLILWVGGTLMARDGIVVADIMRRKLFPSDIWTQTDYSKRNQTEPSSRCDSSCKQLATVSLWPVRLLPQL